MRWLDLRPVAFVVFAVFAACARPAADPGGPPAAPTPVAPPDAPALASSLATEVGPRLAGSAGDPAAVAWALRTMTALGFTGVHSEPVTAPVWRRTSESASFAGAPLAVTALGGSPSTPDAGITAEVVVVHSLDDVTHAPADAFRGRIVFFDVTVTRARDGSGYGAGAKVRVLGPAAAAAKGAVAAVVRSAGTDAGDDPHTGVTKDPEAGVTAIPSAALGVASAERLARTLATTPKTPLTLVLQTARGADATTANVVGDVKGKDPAATGIVLVGAHLDSWDLARGAIDDGCGVGAVLDAAARIARRGGARRTVRVVLFAAEENSGAGGRAYAAAHASEPHASATEMDAGCGAPYEVRVLAGASADTTGVVDALRRAIAPLPIAEAHGEGGSDVQPLRALGVPIVDVRQDMSAYFDIHHTRGDTAAAIDAPALRLAATALTAAVTAIADAPTSFSVIPEAQRQRSY